MEVTANVSGPDAALTTGPRPVSPGPFTSGHGRPEAAAAIRNWREPPKSAARTEASRARTRGSVRAAVAAVAAGLLFLLHARVASAVALATCVLLISAALLSPLRVYAALEAGLRRLGELTGLLVTWILLVPVFYLIFLPFGLLFRRGRADPMKRYYEPERTTYWSAYRSTGGSGRQF